MDNTHAEKLKNAVEYLRAKGKYVLDQGCIFTPTSSVDTDIRETFARWPTTVTSDVYKKTGNLITWHLDLDNM